MTQQWVMTQRLTNASISNAADVRVLRKTRVSAEPLLVRNWLTKVVNHAESWAIVSLEFIASPLEYQPCLPPELLSPGIPCAHCFTHSSDNKNLEGILLN